MTSPISRRTVLRGLGVSLTLPWLEAMGSVSSWAADAGSRKSATAPVRMAFLYVPNGKNMADWTPTAEGTNYELPHILKPLEELRHDFNVLTGLTADKARPHGDGGGDHARALGAFLTGAQPRKTDGTDIRSGISVDQVAASRIGDQTRLASLELGCEAGSMAGNCDSGYSCVYSSTMSWRSATQPLPKEVNPKLIFERMFTTTPAKDRVERDQKRKSVLDFVREDAKDLSGKLSSNDVRKLDEYFSAVRDIEQRIDRASHLPEVKTPDFPVPAGVPKDYAEHIRLMCDLMVLAFQTDVTRVATFVLANEGSNKPYSFIGVNEGHHDLSHHGNDAKKKEKIRDINTFHTSQFAYLLKKLKSIPEGGGTLLDNCQIAYGSGNSDGNAHNHDNLPILLAGRGGGTIQTGRHIKYQNETPLNNLWLSMLERVDVRLPFLGDSTGALKGLNG
ncbi:hypothetical protein ETAA8_43230 [Anatilimnocola aggregata]|uniref:DUF1552 domain-containing protein n=1 Tax=Anatilimnocola aggregata TaxID=2528021 RepID=A0A517YG62_9BACT|nr:DUF1552 domain-containing protein [Anatilimnocola aggregata]QDU29216.1 hypothetical protein ETAA8_43230 [Anatilimnocola aggregata]